MGHFYGPAAVERDVWQKTLTVGAVVAVHEDHPIYGRVELYRVLRLTPSGAMTVCMDSAYRSEVRVPLRGALIIPETVTQYKVRPNGVFSNARASWRAEPYTEELRVLREQLWLRGKLDMFFHHNSIDRKKLEALTVPRLEEMLEIVSQIKRDRE